MVDDGAQLPAWVGKRWHDEDWDAVFEKRSGASHYFARQGLIRKDRLAEHVPHDSHPQTRTWQTFSELQSSLQELIADVSDGAGHKMLAERRSGQRADSVEFVLKKAHSSNASGMRFLTLLEAESLVHSGLTVSRRRLMNVGLGSAVAAGALAGFIWLSLLVTAKAASERSKRLATGLVANIALCFIVAQGPARGRREREAAHARAVEAAQACFAAEADNSKPATWLAQRYIQPHLYKGRKFHLRALLLCVGSLRAYLHEDVRMLIATRSFQDNKSDSSCFAAHVTNMGMNRTCPGYSEASQNQNLGALGDDSESQIFDSMVQVLSSTLVSVLAVGRRHFFVLDNCWELFGVDFLVEAATDKVVLLEINPSPSLAMYGDSNIVQQTYIGMDPLREVPAGWHEVPLETLSPAW